MNNSSLYFIQKFLVQTFLVIPMFFIFVVLAVFLQQQFNLSLFATLRLTDILDFFINPNKEFNSTNLVALLVTSWLILTIITVAIGSLLHFKLSINLRLISRVLHVITFFLLSWIVITNDNNSAAAMGIVLVLSLLSYISSVVYIIINGFLNKKARLAAER